LALVQALVKGMGGQITVESAPGEGSTFVVEFPIAIT
jgi:signal transduction histidine kinase